MFWAHTIPAIFWFCVPATFVVSWLIARVLAPVIPDHLPNAGGFNLHQYRGLATHRFSPVKTIASAAIGAFTHIVLDLFTHNYVWFAQHVPMYTRQLGPWRFRDQAWTLYRIGAWGCHVGLSVLSLYLLYRFGKRLWLADRAASVPRFRPTLQSRIRLWGTTALVAAPLLYLSQRGLRDSGAASIVVLRFCASLFAGLCVGAFLTKRSRRPRR